MDGLIGTLKHTHLGFIALSFLLFLLRGYWMMSSSALLYRKPVKILPHILNTVLLVSGVVLAVKLGLKPGDHPWLMAKMIGLVGYIVLSVVAFKATLPMRIRSAAFVLACLTFLYIVACALTKSPEGFLAYF